MTAGAVLAPGYGGSADQAILVQCASRLERSGIVARRMSFTRARPVEDFAPELNELRQVRDGLRNGGVQKLALIGRSFGGRMCARLAATEPPDALVLLGHPISPPNRPRLDDEAALLAVGCPTLIVQGDHDRLGPLAVLERIAAENRQIEIYVLIGVGHQFGKRQTEGLEHAAMWLEQRLRG
ncbi:MAG: dienelactone hydrolase family protein [Chloroflexi bacterium]|nr:dienelactone hydrolase family protein [Chloroflexota bacterium]MBV9899357.1 dienelactone hydrolase family protein [Chloroflexota bacterium]